VTVCQIELWEELDRKRTHAAASPDRHEIPEHDL
jgi:hypothetical protein